jgi:hypothetical protein
LILTRRAFPIPMPLGRLALTTIAGLVMALVVAVIDRSLHVSDMVACLILVGAGAVTYLVMCWALDISHARRRLKVGLAFFRTKLASIGPG